MFRLVFEVEPVGGTPVSAIPAVVAHYSRSTRVLHVTLEGTEAAGVQGMEEGAIVRVGDWRAFSLVRERAERGAALFALALEPERNYG